MCTESQQLQSLVISVKAEFSIAISQFLSVHYRFNYSFKVYHSSKHWIRVLYVFMLMVYTDNFFLQLISLCLTDPYSSPSIPQASHFTISLSTVSLTATPVSALKLVLRATNLQGCPWDSNLLILYSFTSDPLLKIRGDNSSVLQ